MFLNSFDGHKANHFRFAQLASLPQVNPMLLNNYWYLLTSHRTSLLLNAMSIRSSFCIVLVLTRGVQQWICMTRKYTFHCYTLQLLMFQKRISGEPIGFSVLGIFVINKTTILTVRYIVTMSSLDHKHFKIVWKVDP